uniref:CUB domain-containing protein n=1 Tax=Tetranychus urticae TaxID=32264 RepID=T1KAF7_TETUR
MIKECFSLLFIFILINFQVEAKCNDDCLTKTYCISSDGSGVCSNNNLVTAQFKVIPVFGEYDYLQLTLKGYNVASNDEKTIKASIGKHPANLYTCYKSSLGSTYARYDRGSFNSITGSSYYLDGVLYCTWIFNIDDPIWPQGLDLFKDSSQSITLYHDSMGISVARDTSQLPIYHAQYLKCCNEVHGNDVFLLNFDQTEKQIRYQLYYWKDNGNQLTVTLTRKDGIKLQFESYRYAGVIKGYISNDTDRISIDNQLIEPDIIDSEICSWATPFVLGDSSINIDASKSVFDLKVEVDMVTVYTEKGVQLKNASHLPKMSFILIAFAVLSQIELISS